MKSIPASLMLATLVLPLLGCNDMKKMIDPSGKSFKDTSTSTATKTKSTSSPTKPAASSPAPAPAPAARPYAPGGKSDAVIRIKEPGRFLTQAVVEQQIDEITFQARGRSFRFQKGIFHDKAGITSLRDSSGRFWGLSIGDLNMDGNDDAVLILRTDRANSTPQWDLAYLPNRKGRLFNVQTLALQGDQGFRDVVIEGSSILLVPAIDGRNVHIGYAGGELSFVAQ